MHKDAGIDDSAFLRRDQMTHNALRQKRDGGRAACVALVRKWVGIDASCDQCDARDLVLLD